MRSDVRTRLGFALGLLLFGCKPPPPPPEPAELGALTCMDGCVREGHLDRECYAWCNEGLERWQSWRDKNLPNWRQLSDEHLGLIRDAFLSGFTAGSDAPKDEEQPVEEVAEEPKPKSSSKRRRARR